MTASLNGALFISVKAGIHFDFALCNVLILLNQLTAQMCSSVPSYVVLKHITICRAGLCNLATEIHQDNIRQAGSFLSFFFFFLFLRHALAHVQTHIHSHIQGDRWGRLGGSGCSAWPSSQRFIER